MLVTRYNSLPTAILIGTPRLELPLTPITSASSKFLIETKRWFLHLPRRVAIFSSAPARKLTAPHLTPILISCRRRSHHGKSRHTERRPHTYRKIYGRSLAAHRARARRKICRRIRTPRRYRPEASRRSDYGQCGASRPRTESRSPGSVAR